MCKKDMGVNTNSNLTSEFHLWRIVRDANCLLANIRVAFMFMDKEILKKLFT